MEWSFYVSTLKPQAKINEIIKIVQKKELEIIRQLNYRSILGLLFVVAVLEFVKAVRIGNCCW